MNENMYIVKLQSIEYSDRYIVTIYLRITCPK